MTEEERQRLAEAWLAHHREVAAETQRQKSKAIRDRRGRIARFRTGSRGPRKGDGGRPALTLDTDPDRKIVVAALWYWRTHEARRSLAVLQWLDALFTPHDVINIGTKIIDGAEHLIVENTEPDRDTDKRPQDEHGATPDRRPWSAPGRTSFRKSRLQYLRGKVDRYRNKMLDERETAYLSHAEFAFLLLAAGNYPAAMFAFASVQWEISEVEGKRLAAIFALTHAGN
jgi:hypothetical protein